MRALVTGCAGFIGSHLTEALLAAGWRVTGIDSFTEYYDRRLKERNLTAALDHPAFTFVEADLLEADLPPLLEGVTHLFHLAGEPGVRTAWGDRFRIYTERNLLTTQRLLEAAVATGRLERFLFASTSSVYGPAEALPTPESTCPRPVSPYGVTKSAAEQMVRLYGRAFGVPATILRYFTAYGPRQRPDMAFSRFFRALAAGEEIRIYGDGSQTRDFTYVTDIVAGTVQAATCPAAVGETINLGSGRPTRLLDVIAVMERITGRAARLTFQERLNGEMAHTAADIGKAERLLGYRPRTGLPEGLQAQWEWLCANGERLPQPVKQEA